MSQTKAQKAAAAKLEQYRRQDKDDSGENGGATSEVQESAGGDTDRLLEAITFCRTSLTEQIEEVKVDISLMRQDFQKLWDQVKTAKNRLSTVEDAIPPLQMGSDRMQLQINQLLAKQDDMENRTGSGGVTSALSGFLKVQKVRTRPHFLSNYSLPPMRRPFHPPWLLKEPIACRPDLLLRGPPPAHA